MDNMSMNAGDTDSEVKNLLLQGFRAAKENRREEAYQLFCDVVARDPNNEHGWLYRAATTDSRSEAYVCLEKVLSINPDNQKAQRGLERIREQQQEESEAEDNDNSPAESYMAGPAAASAAAATQERIGGQEYVSNFPPGGKPAPTYGSYDAPAASSAAAQSTYPFQVGDAPARPSSYPGYVDNDQAPSSYPGYGATPPPPQGYPSYNPTRDSQPPPNYNDNYQSSASDPDYGAAAYGNEGATDLDANGEDRRRRTRSGLLILIVFLLLIAGILGAFLFLTRNTGVDNSTQQAAANATSTAQAASGSITTTSSAGTGTATNVAGGTTAAPVAGGTTAAPGGVATTAAPVAGGTTAAPGGAATTAASNNTQAPAATTARPNTPATTAAPPPVTTAAPGGGGNNPAAPTKPILYTVVPGDSLYGIAARNGCSIDSIKAANRYTQPITGNSIFPSNRLIIPIGRPDFRGSGHIVAQGDTLDSIAAKYGTSADAIVKLNGLSGPTDYKVGDPLIIP